MAAIIGVKISTEDNVYYTNFCLYQSGRLTFTDIRTKEEIQLSGPFVLRQLSEDDPESNVISNNIDRLQKEITKQFAGQ